MVTKRRRMGVGAFFCCAKRRLEIFFEKNQNKYGKSVDEP